MIYGPWGHLNPASVCMVDGKCSKEFPKDFSNSTVSNRNGYLKYKRRDNGRTNTIRNSDIENRWIVPYFICQEIQCLYKYRGLYDS